ncbi:MAG TPA: SDR family oxidoreductase [Rectinemataceae bacterium]|nr:SDR family oxidoreductase [Rectinemataceae bacterium]
MSSSKVVIVTGASGGLGAACAAYLAAGGYRVYGTSRSAGDGIEDRGEIRMIRMDITDQASIARAIGLVVGKEGRLDGLVNNAGLHVVGPIECVSIGDIESCWRTNCLGAIQVCREVLPAMRRQREGHIINLSSVGGTVGLPFQGAYSGSKYALEGMTESLRAEVRQFGIRVSLVQPSDIRHQDCRKDSTVTRDYEDSFERVMKIAWADEEKGYPPEKIGPLIRKILENPNPRARYTFGQAFQRAVPLLKRILPNRFVEWALALYYRV